MMTSLPCMKVSGITAVPPVETINNILASMAVDKVQQNRQAESVSLIYQCLQIIRCSIPKL